MKPSRPFRETQLEMLQDSELAALYLEEALADGDMELFKLALKNVADARLGGMTALSKSTDITRESLYRALSAKGNPRLETLTKVLHAVGLRISVTPEATL
ncbi:MAG: addiction module antidote protein [Candidatus Anammoxibacter sp.]